MGTNLSPDCKVLVDKVIQGLESKAHDERFIEHNVFAATGNRYEDHHNRGCEVYIEREQYQLRVVFNLLDSGPRPVSRRTWAHGH